MSKSTTVSTAVLAILAAVSACELVSLDRLICTTYPDRPNQVLEPASSVWVEFSIAPEKTGAERIFKVASPEGNVSGDYAWEGRRLTFTPRAAWRPGVRYVLSLSGSVAAEDGRRFSVSSAVPFFAGSSDAPPRLSASQPASGGAVGGTEAVSFLFSKRMDESLSLDAFFSLSPRAEIIHEWRDDGTRLVVRPRVRWSAFTRYAWTISAELKDTSGIALTHSYEGSFLVQNPAAQAPVIAALRPAIDSAADRYPPAGSPLVSDGRIDGWIGYRDAIRIEFAIPDRPTPDDPARIDFASLQSAFRINPSVTGSLRVLKTEDGRDECFIFTLDPGQRFLADTVYRVTVSRQLKNAEGVAMMADYKAWFTADIPEISVEQIVISNADFNTVNLTVPKELFNSYIEIDASVLAGYAPDYYTVRFNNGFGIDPADAYAVADKISLERIFPAPGGPYEKRNAAFFPGTPPGLTVAYWGVPADDGTVFRLTVKGGPDGVAGPRGSYLPRDVFIYFVVTEVNP